MKTQRELNDPKERAAPLRERLAALVLAAKARALLNGRLAATRDDVRALYSLDSEGEYQRDTLRHASKEISDILAEPEEAEPVNAELLRACKLALGAFENNNAIDWGVLSAAIAHAEGATCCPAAGEDARDAERLRYLCERGVSWTTHLVSNDPDYLRRVVAHIDAAMAKEKA